ncbi:MAG: VWA domain-containing protein [Pseudomonadota bacterium]|nr:VWA domain-containing protein [Pseudomonadota bacterium]
MRSFISLLSTVIIFLSLFTSTGAEVKPQYPEMMFIIDASGSMWSRTETQTRIETAKQVMSEIVPVIPAEVRVGLTAYGHNRKGDCNDIETLIPSGSTDRNGLLQKVMALSPKGMTPMAAAIESVANQLKNKETETTIVLLSDGEETCHDSPCAAVKSLKDSGIKFILHVVGFGVNVKQKEQLSCMAQAGGGQYFGAANYASLLAAFKTVEKEVIKKVEFEKAKSTVKKKSTGLGKLKVVIPESGLRSLNEIKIIRKKDNKVLRTLKNIKNDSTYPFPAGIYELVAGFGNSNYQPNSEVSYGIYEINGGETIEVKLGLLILNISEELERIPAHRLTITKTDDPDFNLTLIAKSGNAYYFYKSKPLLAGSYIFTIYPEMARDKKPVTPLYVSDICPIPEAGEFVVTIDTGIKVKEAQDSSVIGWQLQTIGGEKTILNIQKRGNGWALWRPYIINPGSYQLSVILEGMDEPLLVSDELSIAKGELLEFDTGL